MATTDNVLSDLIINDLTQEQYDALVASGEVQEGQIYATDGTGSGGGSTTGGLESVAHDSSLEGAGTTASPLKVASTVIAQINDKADGTVVETLSSVVSENTTKLNTLRNDTDSLGDQVSGIEEKIPSSASATNQLATKADLPIGFDAAVVAELPATGEKGIIYLVPKDGEAPDVHDEYIWIDSEQKFEFIGSTAVDLTDYVKNTDYASASKGGVFKTNQSYGTQVGASGSLYGFVETVQSLATRNDHAFISKGTLENIKYDLVKRAVTENDITLTDDEKTAAQDWLGIKQGASLPILTAMWSDHVIDDMSWLRADTFSWQSGDVYVAAYGHLAGDMESLVKHSVPLYSWGGLYFTESATPTSGDMLYDTAFNIVGTVESYSSSSNAISISLASGISGVSQSRYESGDTVGEIPEQKTDTIGDITITYYQAEDGHKICLPDQESNIAALYEATGVAWYFILDTENKQFKLPREDKDGKYLYFYVGNFTQEAIEQTAGLNAELFNGKADVATVNGIDSRVEVLEGYDYVVESQQPTADNGYTWYRKYKSGWVEQGGKVTIDNNANSTVSLPVIMANTDYTITLGQKTTNINTFYANQAGIITYDTTQITLTNRRFIGETIHDLQVNWQVSGMSAQ